MKNVLSSNVPLKSPAKMVSQPAKDTQDLTIPGRELLPQVETALIAQGIKHQHSLRRAHFTAIKNWLGKYQPPAGVTKLDQVRGYLEAFYHLCEICAWNEAASILQVSLHTTTAEKLHNQLATWGYYSIQIKLYSILLDYVTFESKLTLLMGLGNAYGNLGDYQREFDYHQQSLTIAQTMGNRLEEGVVS